jgi:hypothetical protein
MFGADSLTVFIPDIALSKPQKSYTGKKRMIIGDTLN